MAMRAEKVEAEELPDTSRRGNFPAPAHSFALRLDHELALRLIERHQAREHFERVHAERERLGQWISWARDATYESVSERVERSLGRFAAGDGWRAELCWRGEPVGSIWLHGLDGPGGSTEIGYWLGAAHQGKGLVTRALRLLLGHFFADRGLDRVSVGLDLRNERSLNVVRRLGLEPEAVLRRVHVDADGAASDLAMFGLLRADWEAREPDGARVGASGHGLVPRFCLEIDADEELYLGLFEREDAEPLSALVAANVEHLRPWMPWAAAPATADQLSFITERALPAIAAGAGFEAGVWSRGRLVGAAGVHSVEPRSRSGIIGYWLDAREQGKGIVTRAVRAVIERSFTQRLFEEGPFERLEISADVGNLRSRAVAERLGFTFEGVLRRQPFAAGRYIDLAVYSLLRSEWEAAAADGMSTSVDGRGPLSDNAVRMDEPREPVWQVTEPEEAAMINDPNRTVRPQRSVAGEERDRRLETALDEALDETFPASDPLPPTAPLDEEKAERAELEEALDEALDDTFPASDPVSYTLPHKDPDEDERDDGGQQE